MHTCAYKCTCALLTCTYIYTGRHPHSGAQVHTGMHAREHNSSTHGTQVRALILTPVHTHARTLTHPEAP